VVFQKLVLLEVFLTLLKDGSRLIIDRRPATSSRSTPLDKPVKLEGA